MSMSESSSAHTVPNGDVNAEILPNGALHNDNTTSLFTHTTINGITNGVSSSDKAPILPPLSFNATASLSAQLDSDNKETGFKTPSSSPSNVELPKLDMSFQIPPPISTGNALEPLPTSSSSSAASTTLSTPLYLAPSPLSPSPVPYPPSIPTSPGTRTTTTQTLPPLASSSTEQIRRKRNSFGSSSNANPASSLPRPNNQFLSASATIPNINTLASLPPSPPTIVSRSHQRLGGGGTDSAISPGGASGVEKSTSGVFVTAKRRLSFQKSLERNLAGRSNTVQDIPMEINGSTSEGLSSASPPSAAFGTTLSQKSKSGKLNKKKSENVEVLVGTPIREDHVNYMLMYDMLTGIRISVSRCNAKTVRVLTSEDFKAAHKLAFDITGNELTPSSKYDFKFKDYAPWAFRGLREMFKIDASEYLLSLTGKYVLSELGSPGKSGSFFYYSQDYRFIIKTIHHSEHKVLLKLLQSYYEHVQANPNTLLCRILGLHRVKLPGGKKIHFVVMGNIFPPNKDVHEIYDLKGSTVGRCLDEEKSKNDRRAVFKDLNWLNRGKKLELGPIKRKALIDQMEKDVAWLIRNDIMDYSLLVGCHNALVGNKENIRDTTLAVFEPMTETVSRQLTKRSSKASAIRKVIAESDPVQLGPSSSKLPEDAPEERKYCVFYKDEGGFSSTDEGNDRTQWIYYIGIIDIFTSYDIKKRAEHFFKSIGSDRKMISAVHPKVYGRRFLAFMKNAIKGFTESTNSNNGTTTSAFPTPSASPIPKSKLQQIMQSSSPSPSPSPSAAKPPASPISIQTTSSQPFTDLSTASLSLDVATPNGNMASRESGQYDVFSSSAPEPSVLKKGKEKDNGLELSMVEVKDL